jgi:hypothetical protein
LPGRESLDCLRHDQIGEAMGSILGEVAAAADEAASDQRRVAHRAREMQHQRDQGWSWSKILDREGAPGLLELLRHSGRRITDATSRLAKTLASGLSAEGESRRHIGQRLGVSHQRVSAMLKDERRTERL